MMPIYASAAIALIAGLYVFEGYQLTLFARSGSMISILLCMGAYASASLLLTTILRNGSYGVVMMVLSLSILLGEFIVSTIIFKEQFTPAQMGGVLCGLIAIFMISLPQLQNQPTI